LSLGKSIAVTLATALAVMAIGVWWTHRAATIDLDAGSASATAPSATAPTASAAPPAPSAPPSVAPEPSATAAASAPEPSASAAEPPASAASATPPPATQSSATELAPPAPVPPTDPASLPAGMGYLRVRFARDPSAQVFFFQKPIGPVEAFIEFRCGNAFINVGLPGSPPRWLVAAGRNVNVACQSVTEVVFQ
jgi:hypothetical protein